MARANMILLLVVSLLVMITVAESTRLAVGFAGKKASALVCNSVYGAEEGDTCSFVAEMFNLSLDTFLAINPNINCDSFFVGQWLCTDGVENGSIMDEPYDSRVFNCCEVKQTELHEGPYPPPSQRYAVLIRITVTLQSAGFQIQTKPPHSFMYNFCPEVTLIGKSKIWVNFMSAEERGKSITCLVTALRRMGLRLKELARIIDEISDKVEPPIHLPQLAVDVTIRLMCCELHGSFDGYDDMRLYRWVKKSWDDSRAAAPTSCAMPPSSCAVCLEEFGGGVDDKMIARLPCSHYFHADCIAQWVVDRHTCPVCRTQMIPLLSDDENQPFDPNPTWSE